VSALLGGAAGPFFGMTVLLFGLAAWATGQALAQTWRPAWQTVPSALGLAMADRFLLYALFDAELLSPGGWAVAAAILTAVMAASYYRTRARKMVTQYPWLYVRHGPFGWRPKSQNVLQSGAR